MNDSQNTKSLPSNNRPTFPARAVVTAGMPYGNKNLHFGHVGGVFIHADVFARFLRDRIGRDNVIFVSGTDCYGSTIVEDFRLKRDQGYDGSIEDFVTANHEAQKGVLDAYSVAPNLFAASSIGRATEIHEQLSGEMTLELYDNGHLEKRESKQFFDPEQNVFLNGRQVTGFCPIQGCKSEKAYADECSLGHQYEPQYLIKPVSALSGATPTMKGVSNWYVKLPAFLDQLRSWVGDMTTKPWVRSFMTTAIGEFLEPPVLYVKEELMPRIESEISDFPTYTTRPSKSQSECLVFQSLDEREEACSLLGQAGIRYRAGKTLVPFRLTGNIEWGLRAPDMEDLTGLTFWVWPESLIAPISFTATYLESLGQSKDNWKEWWCSRDALVYQFIGEDNLFFYGPAEMAMFMGLQDGEPRIDPPDGQMQLPILIANKHLLFLNKKASSSGAVKPPMAAELLDHYTSDQLRAHFLSLGLGLQNVSFQPKPLNPAAKESAGDPVMKEGNLISNVLNRAVRSCFYTIQKHFDGKLPAGQVSDDIRKDAEKTILEYESRMYRHEFHAVMETLDVYIRSITKYWAKNVPSARDAEVNPQAVIDAFHMVRVATVLMHPIAPTGTEIVRQYLNVGEEFWNWSRVFDTLYDFIADPATHEFKFLEPRVDFFEKHPSQFKQK